MPAVLLTVNDCHVELAGYFPSNGHGQYALRLVLWRDGQAELIKLGDSVLIYIIYSFVLF